MPESLPVWECEQVLLRLFRCMDENRIDELVELFTKDGEWHRMGRLLKGHAAIREAMTQRPPTQVVRHVVSNVLFETIEEGAASCVAYMTAYRYDDGHEKALPVPLAGPFLLMGLRCDFRRDGNWKLAALVMRRDIEFPVP